MSQLQSPESHPQLSHAVTLNEVKKAAGLMLGAWALKRYPKTAIFGLIGIGVILGLTIKDVVQRREFAPLVNKDHLH